MAVLPWLGPIFESLEFPGGWKAKFRDLEKAADAIPPPARNRLIGPEEPSYLALRGLDPALALVGLRIEIEKRLQRLAADRDLESEHPSARAIARNLSQAGVLLPDIAAALNEIIQAGTPRLMVNPYRIVWNRSHSTRVPAYLPGLTNKWLDPVLPLVACRTM